MKMADLKSFTFAKWLQKRELGRGWNCPDEQSLASYLDGFSDAMGKTRLQRHLASCRYCRALIAETSRAGRLAGLPALPPALFAQARSIGPRRSTRPRWSWLPLTVAPLGCVLLFLVWSRAPQSLNLPPQATPSAPAISKSHSVPPLARPSDMVRSSDTDPRLPGVIFPASSSVVPAGPIDFRWRAVPHASHYRVRILTAAGELLWQHDSAENHLQADDSLTLRTGRYFVLVSAVMENDRSRQSSPVEFRVAGR